MREIPAWILSMSAWELVGVIVYSQAFALLESLVVFSIFINLWFDTPSQLYSKPVYCLQQYNRISDFDLGNTRAIYQ